MDAWMHGRMHGRMHGPAPHTSSKMQLTPPTYASETYTLSPTGASIHKFRNAVKVHLGFIACVGIPTHTYILSSLLDMSAYYLTIVSLTLSVLSLFCGIIMLI